MGLQFWQKSSVTGIFVHFKKAVFDGIGVFDRKRFQQESLCILHKSCLMGLQKMFVTGMVVLSKKAVFDGIGVFDKKHF